MVYKTEDTNSAYLFSQPTREKPNVEIRNRSASSPIMVYNFRPPVIALLRTGLLFVLGSLLAPISLRAGVPGEVSGTVADPGGSAVFGAKLKLTDSGGTVRETTSDEEGNFAFKGLTLAPTS